MNDVEKLLAETRTILLIDWPSRDVPDSLARAGFTVISNEGPNKYNAYEVRGDNVDVREVRGLPTRVELVYAHRPVDELPDILAIAKSVGAKAVWLQSGQDGNGARDVRGCWLSATELARAREIVEGAGLRLIDAPYIGDAIQRRGEHRVDARVSPRE